MANVSQITIPNQNGTTSTYDIVDRKSGYITKVLNDEFTSDSINTGSLVVRGDSRFVNEIQGTTSGNAKPSDITNAINALDVSKIGSDTEYITSITEVDGKISATKKTFPTIPNLDEYTKLLEEKYPFGISDIQLTPLLENRAITFTKDGENDWYISEDLATSNTYGLDRNIRYVLEINGIKYVLVGDRRACNFGTPDSWHDFKYIGDSSILGFMTREPNDEIGYCLGCRFKDNYNINFYSKTSNSITVNLYKVASNIKTIPFDLLPSRMAFNFRNSTDGKFSEYGIQSNIGNASWSEGVCNIASGSVSHSEGAHTTAGGHYSHTEGYKTYANGNYSHAEGCQTSATGLYSHTEGYKTYANNFAHAGGNDSTASGAASYAFGQQTLASGTLSSALGNRTVASGRVQVVEGQANIEDTGTEDTTKYGAGARKYLHIVGNGGPNKEYFSNAHTLDWHGNAWYAGDVYVGSTSGTNQDNGSVKLAKENEVLKLTGGTVSGSTTIDDLTAGDLLVTGSASFNSNVTAPTQNQGDNSTKVATTAYVDKAIQDLPEPMIFKGSLGTGGTITSLPTAAKSNEGYTYKVITAGTYASISAKVGDTFISDGSKWVLIPSGDEPEGTVVSVGMTVPTGLSVSGSPITSSGTLALSYASGYSIPTNAKQTEWDGKVNKSGDTMSGKLVVGTAGMNIASGKVSGMTSGTTEIYKDGIAISNPATANDVAWMRVVGTGENDTVLEIATGDDGSQAADTREEIAFRQYTTSNTVAREAKIFDKSGNTSFPGTVTGSKFIGPLQGNADSATKATQDGSGNNIVNTYMPFSGGTFTNANNIKYSASQNTIIKADASSVLQSPIPKYLWHDIFAFYPEANITYERSTDGGNTWVAETDKKGQLFINKENQAVNILDTTHNAARFTFNSKISWSSIAWLVIGFTYSNPSCPRDILVESYDSTNEVWRELLKVQNSTSNSAPEWLRMSSPNGDAQLRLTFTKTDLENTASLNISCIKFLSSRWGDQGLGSEIEKPYNWNKAQDIYPNQNNTSNLGTSSYKWANVYATNFRGNADTATTVSKLDGSTWTPRTNITLTAANNNDEWSFDIYKNGKTGTYWQVWDENKATLLKVNADDGKVSAPYGFVGDVTGTASNASKLNNQDASYYLNYNNLNNKPSIPAAANNGTLTIQKNGTQVATFGANQSGNSTANITMTPDDLVIATKTFENYTCTANDANNARLFFGKITPTSSTWQMPWRLKYKLTVTTSEANTQGYYVVDVNVNGSTLVYYNENGFYSSDYRPIYHHIILYPKNGYTSEGAYFGERIQSSRNPNTLARTYKIEILEAQGCTVSFLDTIGLYKDLYNDTKFYYTEMNGTSTGLQESADANDTGVYVYSNGFKGQTGANKIYPYCLFAQTEDGSYESFVMSNSTGTAKTKNPHGFLPTGKIYWNSGSSTYSQGALSISAYEQYHSIDYRYTFNITTSSLPGSCYTFIKWTYNNGLLYLADEWLATSLPTTADGYVYQRIGSNYYTSADYRGSLLLDNTYFYYDNGVKTWDESIYKLSLTGGTVSGSTTIDDLIAGDLLVTGSAKFNNTIQGNINGTVNGYSIAKSVPSNAVFTDHITTATTSGSGNAVTAITADANGALTVTKGTTFLTSHQDISGKANASETGYSLSASGTTVQLKNKAGTVLSTITTQDTNTDTKNTAGSTDTSSKIYLVGATSQAANPQTYSDNQVYATNGQLDANVVRVAEKVSLVYDSSAECLNFVFN